MADTRLGFVGTLPVGAWSNSTAYKYLDVVTYNGSSYVAKTETVPSGTLPTNTTYWQLMASKGDKGDTGEIISASATITDSFGTPTVVVTAGGTSTERTFAFAFTNLKGNGIEDIAETDYTGGVHTITVTESDGTTTNFEIHDGEVSQNALDTILEGYLPMDGYSESAGVGTADNLTTNVGVTDDAPYNFRTTGGSVDVGDRKSVRKLVGGSFVWNQLYKNPNFNNINYWNTNGEAYGSLSASNNVLTLIPTAAGASNTSFCLSNTADTGNKFKKDHIILSEISINPSRETSYRFMYATAAVATSTVRLSANVWNTVGTVVKLAQNEFAYHYVNVSRNLQEGDEIKFKNAKAIDLTLMFGSTIADYIYSLENAQAGTGIAKLKEWGFFTKPYYEYDAGHTQSVEVGDSVTIGFNQFDADSVLVPLGWTKQGDEYYLASSASVPVNTVLWENKSQYEGRVCISYNYRYSDNTGRGFRPKIIYTDGTHSTAYPDSTTTIKSFMFVSTANKIVQSIVWDYGSGGIGTWLSDICINLSWDESRDGEYEDFIKHTYALPKTTLRGIPQVTNGNLWYDGDTVTPDGTKGVKYGIVDLGTLTWAYLTSGSQVAPYFWANIQDMIHRTATQIASEISPVRSAKYVATKRTPATFISGTMVVDFSGTFGQIQIKDSAYTDAATFKTAMSGVYLIYELDEPTAETVDPYQEVQLCDDFGTEYLTDYAYEQGNRDVEIPVGHETFYPINLKSKLEMAPNSPTGSGDYIVRQTNGINEYVALADNPTIQSLVSKTPTTPTENGTYVQKCTVTNGVATYSWVAE